jgi:cell division transport system permease protein
MIRIGWRRRSSPLPLRSGAPAQAPLWVAALVAYLGVLGGAGLVALSDIARDTQISRRDTITLQLPPDASTARLNTVLALLRQTPGIAGARLVEPAETNRLVAPWFGPSTAIDRLPVPRIIDLRVDGAAAPPDLTDLRNKLASIAPGAVLEEDAAPVADLRSTAARLAGTIGVVIAAAFLVTIRATASAATTGVLVHRERIELLHRLGADDTYIAGQLQTSAVQAALLGACGGAAAAGLSILAIGGAGQAFQLPIPAGTGGLADWRAWAILAGAVILIGVTAMLTARLVVLRRLARLP